MNPICPKCKKLMKKVGSTVVLGETEEGKKRLGRRKYWRCSKCGVKYKCGEEIIKPKEVVKQPECFGNYDDGSEKCKTCKFLNSCKTLTEYLKKKEKPEKGRKR